MFDRFVSHRSVWRAGGIAAALALLAAGSGIGPSHAPPASAAPAGSSQIIVGLITKTDTNPFFVKMKQGAQQEASKLGVKLVTAAGKFDGDNETQVTAIQNFVTEGAKGIMITPSNTKAIVPTILAARKKGVEIIALDTPTDPQSAVNALFATNNFTAGMLIGKYARAYEGKNAMKVKIATLDLAPGITVGILRHNGFLSGYGVAKVGPTAPNLVSAPEVVCSQDTQGDQAKGQTAMENCLQKNPSINLVYTINEPAAFGAYRALKSAGKAGKTLIVSIDGGCTGVRGVKSGQIAATSQQYPLKMAKEGVDAIVNYAKTGKKVSGYHDTGVTLIAAKPMAGVPSKSVAYGLANCWG
jgi:fructose transport system substrate-binding protein